jgi:hypothetical protein
VSFLSIVFAAFLAAGLLVYHNAPVQRRPAILLALSFLFYATWSVWDAALLLAFTAPRACSIKHPRNPGSSGS